jgi:hypothetical protein
MPTNGQPLHWPACQPVCKRCDLCTQLRHFTSLQQQQQQQQQQCHEHMLHAAAFLYGLLQSMCIDGDDMGNVSNW